MNGAGGAAARRLRLDEAVLAALLALLAWAVASGGWSWRVDRLLYDAGMRAWSEPPPADVAIVAIDDASIAAIGRWPWPRAVHTTLLERLVQARPRGILLDLVLSEADPDPRQDALLAAALQAARAAGVPVVLPVAWQPGADGRSLALLEPQPAFGAAAVLGAAEAAVDDDGVLRHAFLRAGPAAAPYPHVALALLQAAGQAPAAGLATERGDAASAAGPWRRDERLAIRYLGPPGHIERIGVVDVLTGRSGPERLRDRWLLVGLTAQGLGDTLATPVNAMSQAMPGVEVIANTLQTLRSGQAVRTVEPRTLAAVSAVLAGLWVPLMSLAGPRRALPLTLAAVPLALLATPLALRGGWFASSVPWVLALLMAYPLWSWRRLERAMAGLDDELRHLAGEPLLQTAAALPMPAGPDPIAGRLQLLRRGMDTVRGARAFLADALEALPGAVLVGDAAGRVLLGNAGAAEVFETGNAAELQGLDLARLLAEFETPAAVDWATALAAAAGASHPARGPDGRDWLIHVAPTTLRGERCAVVVLSDLTPLKQAEREREEALAFVSHDLRSPAAAIVSLSRLRADGTLPMDDRAYLAQVQELASRTLSLADEFVRVLQAQSRPLQLAPVAVAALVQAGCGEQQAPAREAGVALVEQIDAEAADAVVQVDRLLVERALANLVGNAIRHSPRGGSVELRARLDGTRLRLRVSDQGPGLAAAQREAISRGHTAAVGDARGVGLGLQFVQRVAARHRGRLLAPPPAAGTGAVLELELPFPGNP